MTSWNFAAFSVLALTKFFVRLEHVLGDRDFDILKSRKLGGGRSELSGRSSPIVRRFCRPRLQTSS